MPTHNSVLGVRVLAYDSTYNNIYYCDDVHLEFNTVVHNLDSANNYKRLWSNSVSRGFANI